MNKFDEMMQIEENLKVEMQRLLLVMINSSSPWFRQSKMDSYIEQVPYERLNLNIESLSTMELKKYIRLLKNKTHDFDFMNVLLFQENYALDSKIRLYSHLKNELLRRKVEQNCYDMDSYYQIYEARLLSSYFEIFEETTPEVNLCYLPIFYFIFYSFVGLEHPMLHKINLRNWVPNIQNYKTTEKIFVLKSWKELLKKFNEFPIYELYQEIPGNAFFFSFDTLYHLLSKYFTIEEIYAKISELVKEEEKQEWIQLMLSYSNLHF